MNTSIQADAESMEQTAGANQYLTFILGTEEYGIDILKVQEIRSWEPVTHIPNTPDYVLGIVNLRGTVVPVIDLRLRFNMDREEYGATTIVVVVKIEHEGKIRVVGMVADAVSEVYYVKEEDIRPTPDIGSDISIDFIKGLATVEDKLIILLEIDVLVNSGILEDVSSKI